MSWSEDAVEYPSWSRSFRLPITPFTQQRICQNNDATHDGGDGDLFRFSRIHKLLIFVAEIDLQLRKLMQRSGQSMPEAAPILELNPAHPIVHTLAQKVKAGEKVDTLAHILLDVASIQNGETPKDVNAFSRRLMEYLAQDAKPEAPKA